MQEALFFCHQVFTNTRSMSFVFQDFMAPLFEAVDLKPLEGCVLAEIGQNEGVTLSDLANATSVRATNLTPLTHSLEEKGLISRKRDEADARSWRLSLSPEGRKLLDRLCDLIAEQLAEKDNAADLMVRILDGFNAFSMLMQGGTAPEKEGVR